MGAQNVMKYHMDPAEVARIMAADAPPTRDQTIARLKNDIGKQKQVYKELVSDFKDVTVKKDAEIAAVNKKLMQTLARVDELQRELADLKQEVKSANMQITELTAHTSKLEKDLDEFSTLLVEFNELKQQYEARIDDQEDEINHKQAMIENQQQIIEDMEQLLNDKKDQLPLVSTCNQSETINEEVIHLMGVVETLKEKLCQLRKQLHEKEDSLRMLTEENYHHDLVTHTAMMVQEDNPYRSALDDKIALMLWEGYHQTLIHELAVGLVGVEYSEDRNKRKAWFVALMWFFGMVFFCTMPYFTNGPPIADTFSMRVVMMIFKKMKHNFIVTKIYSLVNAMAGSEMVMTSLQRYIQLI